MACTNLKIIYVSTYQMKDGLVDITIKQIVDLGQYHFLGIIQC